MHDPRQTITSTEEAIEALNTQIKHFLTDQLRKNKDRDKLKADLPGKQRLPKGFLLNIDQLCGNTPPWFASNYHKRFHFLNTWRGYIKQHYDELAAMIPAPTASSSKASSSKAISSSHPTKPTQKEEITVAHKSLRQTLLAINESPDALSKILSTSKDARIAVTKYSPNMFTLFLPFGQDLYEHVWKRFPGSNIHSTIGAVDMTGGTQAGLLLNIGIGMGSLARLWAADW
ncbi:hypothetical protein DM01DRAFT_1348803 [Hesseltinella vesiculosa]|uniref:Uncharacterized protein n=1 Tax=Hesseltinella vesiculosa TaxID=101127 RepID=A0A1X2G8K1_9FUNG|nr:hypothetical protein DM01DRAFT_1348803 [Hesseltinella vesiculosa]